MVSYGSHEDLSTTEKNLIDRLGITIADDAHWPAFTDYSMAYSHGPLSMKRKLSSWLC